MVKARTISVAQAAAELGIGCWSIRASIKRGELRAVRLGKRYRVLREALDELLAVKQEGGART
jgi:excisionase family DNA binding protein